MRDLMTQCLGSDARAQHLGGAPRERMTERTCVPNRRLDVKLPEDLFQAFAAAVA